MKRLKRSAIWLLIACLVAAALLMYGIHRSTDLALQRAEAFEFRRMTLAQLDTQNNYRFFYATNRPLQQGLDASNNQRSEHLTLGHFDTAIEPSVGLGMLINPTAWFQNEEIELDNIEQIPPSTFNVQLRQLIEQSPQRSLLIIVHGYKEAFESALRKTAFLSHVLDINTPVLVFDWPGNQGSSLRGYRSARDIATASGAELAQLLDQVVSDIKPQRLWLIANSMGAQVVVNAFETLYEKGEWADSQTELEHLVLTAPDVAEDEFDSHFKQRVLALTQNLTVYMSSNDRALVISRLVNRGSRLGESPINPSQLEEAARLIEMVEPDEDSITLVDVTPVNRTRNFHNFSLETPEFFDDLYLRLINESTPQTRLRYQLQTPQGKVFWVLTQGR